MQLFSVISTILIVCNLILFFFFFISDGAMHIRKFNALETKEARQTWERTFDQIYIQPVLTNLDKNLATAIHLVANDNQQGY